MLETVEGTITSGLANDFLPETFRNSTPPVMAQHMITIIG
jgi:hypothetical protein